MRDKILEAYKTLSKFVVFGARGQPPLWPFSIIETNWYYTKFFPSEIYNVLKALESKKVSKEKIAKLCWGPSAISHWFYIVEPTFGDPNLNPFEGLSKEEGIEFMEKTVDILSNQRRGDIFCRDRKNLLMSDYEIKDLINNVEFVSQNNKPNQVKDITIASLSLWHSAILIQAGHRAYSHEFHGPYEMSEGVVFIKDFFNLKPGVNIGKTVWKFTEKFPFNEICIIEIYPSETKIDIDIFNHYDNVATPKAVGVLINGNHSLKNEEEIRGFKKKCNGLLDNGNKAISESKGFSKSDWVEKIIWLRYLWLKPHKDIIGIDWLPPNKILELKKMTKEAERVASEFEKNIVPLAKGAKPDELVDKIAATFVNKIYENGI